MNINQTSMGYIAENISLTDLSQHDMSRLISMVLKHGVICIKNQRLKPSELHQFTAKMGDCIVLHDNLAFNNRDSEHHSVVRISNIRSDGTLIENFKGAEYWHQDGDFNSGIKKSVWNVLYADTVPSVGGDTGFCDAQRVLSIMPKTLRDSLQEKSIVINPNDIPDFTNIVKEFSPVTHEIILHHPKNNTPNLYLGGLDVARIIGVSEKESKAIIDECVDYLTQFGNAYFHKWQKGDVLIWDNLAVYHRSMGGYGNQKRLLYRTQARMFQSSSLIKTDHYLNRS